jgi:hypothetical protein
MQGVARGGWEVTAQDRSLIGGRRWISLNKNQLVRFLNYRPDRGGRDDAPRLNIESV